MKKLCKLSPWRKVLTGASIACAAAMSIALPVGFASAGSPSGPDSLGGLPAGSIQHVWLIILENKSYDETFTGLNNNSYLWQTLPSEGVLLKNYYGTGHSSMDNYISLASGQAPEEDTQEDCSTANIPFGSNSTIITSAQDIADGGTGTVGGASPNWNFGQVLSSLGANAPLGAAGTTTTNGCTYPSEVATLFDQFNLAGVSWKGYAQDLGGAQPIGSTSFVSDSVPGRDDGPCGAPGSSTENPVTNPTYLTATTTHPLPSDVSSFTSASLVAGTGTTNNPQYSDQYVAKHFPFPWFESLIGSYNPTTGATGSALTEPDAAAGGGTNCDANHIANLDSPTDGLVHDLQNNTVPQFSWITPDNCSDAHDTSCKGNNLTGAFGLNANGTVNLNDPIYDPPGLPAFDPEATTPRNYTGGLYASDLFLAYYIPLIEDSGAYAHGLIDITFDEGEPSFTYSGNSFNNVLTSGPDGQGTTSPQTSPPADAPTFGSPGTTAPNADSIYGAYGISADAAGENIGGTNVTVEPYGPNSTLATDANGDQLDPGPGNNSFIDRPPACTQTTPTLVPANCVPNIARGGSGTSPAARTDSSATGSSTSSEITDPSVIGDDTGREVTSITVGGSAIALGSSTYTSDFPNGLFVGAVSDTGPLFPTSSGGATVAGQFQLVDDAGNPINPPGAVTSVTLSAECDPATGSLPSTCGSGQTVDPLYDALDPTPGGGDTGSVLISPYITPGTTSTTDYNHYSWLRTMEDLFDVSSCYNTPTDITLPAGTVCGGLDGEGHLGYAAQANLDAFGADVFSSPSGNGFQQIQPPNALPESPMVIALPALAGIVLMGGLLVIRRRRRALAH
ncbi:MAG: phosphoesterase [Acidimicrobiales bacterium]